MGAEKKEAPYTLKSIRGLNNFDNCEVNKYDPIIDSIDLENDFLTLTGRNENPFPIEIYPKILQEIIFEAHNKYQFPIDYLGAGILSAASAAIGVTYKIKVKTGWIEKCNLFTVIVGRPGDSKSHALNFCFKPIHIREDQLFHEYEHRLQDYEQSLGSEEKKIKKPRLEKFLISDFTPEALVQSHSFNKRGLYIYVDELHGWIKNFNRYNNSGEAETYLSLWSGTTISIDRASGKSLRIKDPFIGVIGSTQIIRLKEFAKEGRNNNGFMDRLLFVYPEDPKSIKWNLNKVDSIILENYFVIISNLVDLKSNDGEPNVIPLEREAKEYLFNWQNNRPNDYFFDYERSIEVKLQNYVIRFALILQLIYYASDKTNKKERVELFAVKGAIKLFDYYYNTALKVRNEISKKNYLETLTELQRTILKELPEEFSTKEGIAIACQQVNSKPRISQRQFKTYLKDRKLFRRLKHGVYKKLM